MLARVRDASLHSRHYRSGGARSSGRVLVGRSTKNNTVSAGLTNFERGIFHFLLEVAHDRGERWCKHRKRSSDVEAAKNKTLHDSYLTMPQ